MASYKGEFAPGFWNNAGVFVTNPDFKIYSVYSFDNAGTNPDYANWDKMVPFGAPYVDLNNNGQYDPTLIIMVSMIRVLINLVLKMQGKRLFS